MEARHPNRHPDTPSKHPKFVKTEFPSGPKAFLSVCLWLLAAQVIFAAPTVLRVNPWSSDGTASPTRNGLTWNTAYTGLQEAIDAAQPSAAQPVQIWIVKGTYYPPTTNGFQLKSHIQLMGGFTGTETSSDQRVVTTATVLSADVGTTMKGGITDLNLTPTSTPVVTDGGWKDNLSNVLSGNRVTDVLLDDLIITGGSATADESVVPQTNIDGMETFASVPNDTSTLITTVIPVSSQVAGGGLFFTAAARTDANAPADLTISRCTFTGNHARGFGGAILLRDAIVDLSNTVFTNNVADNSGGAISSLNSLIYADTCTFANNNGVTAAGAVDLKAYPTLKTVGPQGDPNALHIDEPTGLGGPGSTRDQARIALGYELTGVLSIQKAIAIATTEGGFGAKFRAALPDNPFGAGKSIGNRVGAAYALITIGVGLGDMGVELALELGESPDNQDIKNWQTFSYYFNTYATPAGLVSLGAAELDVLLAKAGVSLEQPIPLTREEVKRDELDSYNTGGASYFIRCNFNGNTTQGQGGAMLDLYSNVQVENSWFVSNSAATSGGAISAGGYTTPRLINSVFEKNSSSHGQSAVANADHAGTQVLNCTFYQNSSSSSFGYALSAERGSSVRVSNSVFWGNLNADAANLSGGADVFAATGTTIDSDTKALYDPAGANKVDWIGTMQLKNCDIQSLSRIPLGTGFNLLDIIPFYIEHPQVEIMKYTAQWERLDANGDTELAGIQNSGEGVRSDLRDAAQANFSSDPAFETNTVTPSVVSPLIDKGSDARIFNSLFTEPSNSLDVMGNPRRVGAAVDVGAIELQPTVARTIEVAQAGNPDWSFRRVYVKPAASGDGSGSSWANATNLLASAMNSLGAEVWVAAGTYHPALATRNIAFILANGTQVYGGFAGTETSRDQRNWKVNQTIFSGEIGGSGATGYSQHLVTCSDVSGGATLNGVYFQNSYSVDTDASADYAEGGAVAMLRSSPSIVNCVFSNCQARNGAAVWSGQSDIAGPSITGCEFDNNTATVSGGAVYGDLAMWVTSSRFFGNTAPVGGAIMDAAGRYCIVQQCLFWNNSASQGYGGAIYAAGDALTVGSTTIYGNFSTVNTTGLLPCGAGVYFASANPTTALLSVSNSILYKNVAANLKGSGRQTTETDQLAVASTEQVLLDHTILQGLGRYLGSASYLNFDADPQFVSPGAVVTSNFALLGNSPAIDAGKTNGYTLATDLAGATRVKNSALDLGPYEYASNIPSGGVSASVTATLNQSTGVAVNRFTAAAPTGATGLQWQVYSHGAWVTLGADSVFSGVGTKTLVISGAPFADNGELFRLAYTLPGFNLTYYSKTSRLKVGSPIIYVKANAIGANDGSSWANAYANLRDALDVAQAGSQVWVAAGTYFATSTDLPNDPSATLAMHSGIGIYGGFSGVEWDVNQRNPRTNVTTISGRLALFTGNPSDPNTKILFQNTGACDRTAILDGFTMSNFTQDVVSNRNSSPTIRNCVFKNNAGEVIYNSSSAPYIGSCEFRANSGNAGEAVYNSDSSTTMENCLIADNVSTSTVQGGAGALQFGGSGDSVIANCTLVNNAGASMGAALTVDITGTLTVRNSVIWGNAVGDTQTSADRVAIMIYSGGRTTISNCCLQGATSATNGNFAYDPLFLDPVAGDYRVSPSSPTQYAASTSTYLPEDLLGISRVSADIGAYEPPPNSGNRLIVDIISLPVSNLKVKSTGGGTASFSVTLPSGSNFSFGWQVNTNDGAGWLNLGDLSDSDRFQVVADGNGSTLTISGVNSADNGLRVRIVASNFGNYTSPGSTLTVIAPTIIYVDANAGGAKNGQSWADAYNDLSLALSSANETNEVWVAKGIYTPRSATLVFLLPTNVEIYGGFAGGEGSRSDRDWQHNETILHPASGKPTAYSGYSASISETYSVLDGFILENAMDLEAVNIHQRSQFLQNCVFRNCAVAVKNDGGNPSFINCVFSALTNNAVQNNQAGAAFSGCRFQDSFMADRNRFLVTDGYMPLNFTDCVFSNNNVAACINGTQIPVTLSRCQFLGNTSSAGAVLTAQSGALTIDNSLFAGNSTNQSGAAVYSSGAHLTVRNSTFADNAAQVNAGAIFVDSNGSDATIVNSIFWGNRLFDAGSSPIQNQQVACSSGAVPISFSIIEGLSSPSSSGNQGYAPLFVDAGAGNYRLLGSSPAIDAGQRTSWSSANVDLDLLLRVSGNAQDIGAYEFQGTPDVVTVHLTQEAESQSVPVLVQTSFTFAGPFLFHWEIFDVATQTWIAIDPNSPDYQVVVNGSASSLVVNSASLAMSGTQFRVRELPGLPVILTVTPPQIYYVDGGVASAGDGKSWNGAFQNIQQAIWATQANSATTSSEIWVKAGTYSVDTLEMQGQIQLYGGFDGSESSRDQRTDWAHKVTTLVSSASGAAIKDTVFQRSRYSNSLLDGFTISSTGGGGYYAYQSSPIVRNCTFDGALSGVVIGQNSKATFQGCNFQNIGVVPLYSQGTGLTLDHCKFRNNTSIQGVVISYGGSNAVAYCEFTGNSGGTVLNFPTGQVVNETVSHCKFTGNTSNEALIHCGGLGSCNFDNTLIADNTTTFEGVVNCGASRVNFNYCTIANNRSAWTAIGARGTTQVALSYSIVWGNRDTQPLVYRKMDGVVDLLTAQILAPAANAALAWNIVEGLTTADPMGNSGFNPLFSNPDAGDYGLTASSPALNRGDGFVADSFGTTDLAGAPRRYPVPAGVADLGAYEFQSASTGSVSIYGDYGSRRAFAGTQATFSFWNSNGSVQWQVNRGDGNGFVPLTNGGNVSIQIGSLYALTLTNLSLDMNGWQYRFVISGSRSYTSPPATLTVVAKPILYVNVAATGTASGASWPNAFTNILDAVNYVYDNNLDDNPEISAEIWVARGVYDLGNQSGTLSRGLEIYGGFAGGETSRSARDVAGNVATIIAHNGTAFDYTDNPESIFGDPIIDGVTFSGTGGVAKNSGNLTINNCRFDGITDGSVYNGGGALTVTASTFTGGTNSYITATSPNGAIAPNLGSVLVQHCQFLNGTNASIYCAAGTVSIEDSIFQSNTASGGDTPCVVSYDTQAKTNITRCQFLGNSVVNALSYVESGGAIYIQAGTMTIRQSLFAGNTGVHGGAIANNDTLELYSVTAADNTVSSTDYAGAVYNSGARFYAENCIFWGNKATISDGITSLAQVVKTTGGTTTVQDTAMENAFLTIGPGALPISYDPRFVGGGDYRLTSSSPYIGAGRVTSQNVLSGETDLAGNARLTAGSLDYGAYQNGVSSNPVYTTISPGSKTQTQGGDVALTIGGRLSSAFVWQFSDDGGVTWKSLSQLPGAVINNVATQNGISTLTLSNIPNSLSGYQFRVSVDGSFTSTPATITVTPPETLFVDAAAPSGGNGKSWATAFNSLDTAISVVNVTRRILHVAEGVYVPAGSFNIQKRMEIYGGYPTGGDSVASPRDPVAHPAILSGLVPNSTSRKAIVVSISGGYLINPTPAVQADTILDGLVIQDGQTGIAAQYANPTIRNVTVKNCTNGGLTGFQLGGSIDNCRFLGNTAAVGGGAFLGTNCSVAITRSVFQGNTATYRSGGLEISSNSIYVKLAEVVISGNYAAQFGGGLSILNALPTLENCVITANQCGLGGGGIYAYQSGPNIENSILWANRSNTGSIEDQQLYLEVGVGGDYRVISSDIEGVSKFAANAIGVDPLFVSGIAAASAPTLAGDFHLNSSSPVINAGNSAYTTSSTDLDGAPRLNGIVDIGAYEFQGTPTAPLLLTQQPVNLVFSRLPGAINQFQVQISGSTFTYQWQSSVDGASFSDVSDGAGFSGVTTDALTVLNAEPTLNGVIFRCKISANTGGTAYSNAATLTVYPARYYVNAQAADDTGNGFTWGSAMKTLARAVNTMRIDPATGVEVWVAAGTYVTTTGSDTSATFALQDKVSLYGGFAGGETVLTARNVAANATVLHGIAGSASVVTGSETGTAVIDGFTIGTGVVGVTSGGQMNLMVSGCSFGGLTTGIMQAYYGTLNSPQRVTVAGCRFSGVTGAGVQNWNGPLVVADSVFTGNGQGISHGSGYVQILRSEFRGNGSLSGNGGGIFLNNPTAYGAVESSVEDSLFSGNLGLNGGGIYCQAGNFYVRNCTMAGNYAQTYGGGAYFTTAGRGGVLGLTNSIVWDNASGQAGTSEAGQIVLGSFPPIYTCDVQNAQLQSGSIRASSGNVSIAPGFVQSVAAGATATLAGDFHLSPISRLIDLGSNAYLGVSATDLAKAPRTFGAAVDLGAYEYEGTVLTITSQPADAIAGFGVAAQFSVATNAAGATYQWQVSTDGGATFMDMIGSANEQGVTTAALTVAGVASYDGRKYRVHVTTPQPGDVTSNAAMYHYLNLVAQPGLTVRNASLTGTTNSLSFTLPGAIDASSISGSSFSVQAMETGRLSLQSGLSVSGNTVTLQPTLPLKPGELVEVTVTSGVAQTNGYHTSSLVYQFHAGSTSRYGIFPQTQTVANAPSGATCLAKGDLDGDGAIDLVVGGANGATVLHNNGSLTFTTSQTVSTGGVSKVALGSLGFAGAITGRLDLVLVKADGAVEIWKNGGAATFTLAATLSGVGAKAIGLADFNGDGALDLFIATAGADQVWLNNGSGAFTDSLQRLGTGAGVDVAVGDLNNDNNLDVVVANGAGNLEVWLNNGAGVFSTASFSGVGSPADRVFLADADKNGSLDVVTARNGQSLVLWINGGANGFAPQYINGSDGGQASWTCVGDLDGDGLPDFVAASAYDGSATLRKGLGFNPVTTYTEFSVLPEQPALSVSGAADLADLDGDGRQDLISVVTNGTVQVALYQVIDQTVDENQSVSLSASGFQTIYNDLPAYGSARTLAAIQVTSLPNGTLKQNGTAVTVGQVIPVNSMALTFTPTGNSYGFTSFAWLGSINGVNFGAESYRDNVLVNHIPQALHPQPDSFSPAQGGSISGNVLTNDANGDPLTAKVVVPPSHGAVTMSANGDFTYTHDGAETPRLDQFTYQVTDAAAQETATAIVYLTIINRNDPPSSITFSDANIYEQSPVGTVAGVLTATDPDAGYSGGDVTLSLVAGASNNAEFTISGQNLVTNAVLSYADGSTRSVRVRATDSLGLYIDRDFVVSLKSIPVAAAQSVTVLEDGSVNILLGGLNGDGQPITSYALTSQTLHGALVINGASVTYTPAALFWGSDAFTFTISDGVVTSPPATISITVSHVNHAPVVNSQTLTVTENTPVNFTVTGSDADGDPLTFQVINGSGKGTVTGVSPNFTFMPAQDKSGDFQFYVVANDGFADSTLGLVSGTISVVDYPPVASALQSYVMHENESLPLALLAQDRNGKSLNYRVTAAPAHGRVTGSGPSVIYTPDQNYFGSDSFQFVANNGVFDSATAGTIQIQVNHVNQPPMALAQQLFTSQTQAISVNLGANDPDGDPLAYTITRGPQHGVLSGIGADRTYTPTGIYAGADSFEFSVTDGQYTDVAVVDISVVEVALKPVADSQLIPGHANIAATIELTGSDPKGLPLTYTVVNLPAHGELSGSVPDNIVYTPQPSYSGSDSFTFTTNNGTLDSNLATVSINLPKDLTVAPIVQDDFVEEAFQNQTIAINVLANDSDFYNSPLQIVSVTTPSSGMASISVDQQSVSYTAGNATSPGYASFQYTVSNGSPYTATATVFVKVVNQNLVVTSSKDSGPGTLRDVVATINGSTQPLSPDWNISFSPGITLQTLQLSTGDNSDPDSAIVVTGHVNIAAGLTPVPVIQVDTTSGPLRAFHVMPEGILRLNGVTVAGGLAHLGGAVLNEGALTVDTATLTANTAFATASELGQGGGVYTTGVMNLTNATINNNVADVAGGFYQLGNGVDASTMIDTATLSGQSSSGDFLSKATNGGTAKIDATALSAETPTAPWFGPLPASATIAQQYRAEVPVLVAGDAYKLTAASSNPNMSAVVWSGRGTLRTLTLSGFTPVSGAQTRLTATASNGSVSFVEHTDITVDPASSRTPVATDDSAAVPFGGSVLIPVLANDYDPDGGTLTIVSVGTPAQGGSATIEGNGIRFTHNSDVSTIHYGFSYTVQNAAGLTATAEVSVLRVVDYNLNVYSGGDLSSALDTANQYYAPGGWKILIDPDFAYYNGGLISLASTASDHGVGDSAYLVTGNVTIDASASSGFTIQRDPNGSTMRLFRVTDTGNLTLRDVILDGGVADHGGVLLNEGSTLLDHSTITDGSAVVGGGVFNEGALQTDTAVITANTASSFGGALYNRNGSAEIHSSTLSNNSAADGGGVHLLGDDSDSQTQLFDTTVNNPGALHDLSATVSGNGSTVLAAAGATSVAAPGDTWVDPIADQAVHGSVSTPFTFTAPLSAVISAESLNEAIVPSSGLSLSNVTTGSGTLEITASNSGFAKIAVLASKGQTAFGQLFTATVYGNVIPPVLADDSATLYQGATVSIPVLTNDTDPQGAPLTVQSVSAPQHGMASTEGTVVTYTHDGSATLSDSFTYVATDTFGGTSTATVHITLVEPTLTVTTADGGGGAGTIRQALEFAAANPTSATWKIVFSGSIPANSIIDYTNFGPYYNGYTMFHIAGNVLIDGSQVQGLVLEDGGGQFGPPLRFFHVQQGASLELRSLTLSKGRVQSDGEPETGLCGGGGAVLNEGTFVAKDVTFLNNVAPGNVGGAVASCGNATLIDCAFTGNSATSGQDRSARQLGTGFGGAVYQLNGRFTITNCTFNNNSAPVGASIYSAGDIDSAELNLTGSTLASTSPVNSQIRLVATNGGTVTRNSSNNILPDGETAPWIASIAPGTLITGPIDLPVTLGLPSDSYTVSASASPSASVSSIALSGAGANLTLSAAPAAGSYGAVDLIVTIADGPLTVNEAFSATIIPPSPASPSGLVAIAVSDSQVLLNWTDNATTESNYAVERSANGVDGWAVVAPTLVANTTSFIDNALSGSTQEFYRVRCDTGGVVSGYSNVASATTTVAVGDGIPGWWRYLYFGDGTQIVPGSEPGSDPDGDGRTNLQEYLAGTSPIDASSVFAAKLTRNGGTATLSFPTVIGEIYQIEVSSDVGAGVDWTVVSTNIAGTGGNVSYMDANAGNVQQRFYRVSIQQ